MKLIAVIFFVCLSSNLFSQSKDSSYVFYFNTNESIQIKDSLVKFNRFYLRFRNCKTCKISLEAHADKVGNTKANLILAEKRLVFVKSLLNQSQTINDTVFGERKAQKTKNNAEYRCVRLNISSPTVIKSIVNNTQKNAVLNPIEKEEKRFIEFSKRNESIRLNILFHSNSTELLEESYEDLNLLLAYLKKYPTIKAQFTGHVCCGDDMMLSRNRAFYVYNFLYKRGIDRTRMSHDGASNHKPIVKEINEAAEQINRRVEVIFTE